MKPLQLHPLAERELFQAIDWYEAKTEGLGEQFLDRVTEGLSQIKEYPESGPLLGHVRRLMLRQFPYSIVYCVDPGVIFVVAIAHQRRQVDYWRDRF